MISNAELLQTFFKEASNYLGRPVKQVTIRERGLVVPKLDELTHDSSQYAELCLVWGELLKKSQLLSDK